MNRNTESHFAQLPSVSIGRSKFDRGFTHKTTFNTGELVPVYVDMDIVPGDTITMRQSELVRMTTPLFPVMDNCWLDFYWFFVPNRLVWNNFKMMMGENETAPWTQTTEKTVPQIKIDTDGSASGGKCYRDIRKGSVLNHMGIPITDWSYATPTSENYKKIEISQLPTRAYCLVWNEFFRDENLQNPVNIPKDDATVRIINQYASAYTSNPEVATVQYEYTGGLPCLKVAKPHDYFTSALPGMQKGPAVTIGILDDVPVVGGPLLGSIQDPDEDLYGKLISLKNDTDPTVAEGAHQLSVGAESLESPHTGTGLDPQKQIALYANMSNATMTTITQLRQAFAIQKFYERDARGGTRYIESVKSHFGVTNPDFRMQRPEYLGGYRHNINMNQVVQTTPVENNSTPLGATGAYSVTSHSDSDVFTHSFTEHGILLGLCCVRTTHTYQQGINRAWFKKKRLDFYSPEFANLSEQAILNQEIYAQGNDTDREAFGYQEAWAEMRYMPDMVTGELSSKYTTSLDYMHYADWYETLPSLGNKWIQETDVNVKRTLAIQTQDQFIADFYFGAIYTRPMPLYSIPGLIDHH